MSSPLMRAVTAKLTELSPAARADVVIDAPPGTSCPAIAAVLPSDLILLVTEPTPFGYHDFRLAHEAFRPLQKLMAAVINRAGLGERSIYDYCHNANIPILAEIPVDRRIAEAYSRGSIVAAALPEMKSVFSGLVPRLRELAAAATVQEETIHA